ncbi:DUF6731 family protein [Nostoc sp. DSM 114159]|jgi:hypothetical protein
MNKAIKVDFFKLVISGNQNLLFEEILQKILKLSSNHRFRDIQFQSISLHNASLGWQQMWEGEIIRLRMDNIPVKGDRLGNIEDITLADNEGIGELTAFLYNPSTKILLFQNNQHGISPGAFAKYFEQMSDTNSSINLEPVMQLNFMERLANLKTIKELDIRIAGIDNIDFGKNDSLKDFIDFADYLRAPNLKLQLTSGRKRNHSLSCDNVLETISNVFKNSRSQQSIKQLKVYGTNEDNDRIMIDILKDRMKESIDIKSSSPKRNVPYPERQQALRDAWNLRSDEILKMYKS